MLRDTHMHACPVTQTYAHVPSLNTYAGSGTRQWPLLLGGMNGEHAADPYSHLRSRHGKRLPLVQQRSCSGKTETTVGALSLSLSVSNSPVGTVVETFFAALFAAYSATQTTTVVAVGGRSSQRDCRKHQRKKEGEEGCRRKRRRCVTGIQ